MKRKQLNEITKTAKKIAVKNTHLICDNLLFKDGYIYATNLEIYLKYKTDIQESFLIDCTFLNKVLTKIKNDPDITFLVDDRVHICIDGVKKFSVENKDINDFPGFPPLSGQRWDYTENNFNNMHKAAKYCSDYPLRPVINSICIDDHIVGSDAHYLVFFKNDTPLNDRILIHKNHVKFIKKDFVCYYSKGFVRFDYDDHSVLIKQTEGQYPSYKNVIPKELPGVVTLPRLELIENLELADIAASSHLCVFNIGDNVRMVSEDIDFNTSFEHTFNVKASLDVKIGFSITRLITILKDIKDDSINLQYANGSRAVIINKEYLLMPMEVR